MNWNTLLIDAGLSEREAEAVYSKIKKVASQNIRKDLRLDLIGKINNDVKVSSSVKQRALFCSSYPNSTVYKDIINIANNISAKLEQNVLVPSTESGLSGLFKRLIEHF
ncbi:MAG: hypothetical protein ABGW74_00040 [Campylobacterales bacterium]